MATTLSQIETLARLRLDEATPRFWSSDELVGIIVAGVKDLWRDVVNLKQEHFLTINESVTVAEDTEILGGLPNDLYKVYLIEPISNGQNEANAGLVFKPADYNSPAFQSARASENIDPLDATIYYAVISAGGPVGAPYIYIAPKTTDDLLVRLVYVPTLSSSLAGASDVPIPGDCDNALVAWTVAYARAKERGDRSPDPAWLATYKGEKDRILMGLGVRNLQEPEYVPAVFEAYS